MKALLEISLLFAGLALAFSGCNIFLDGEGEEDTPCYIHDDCAWDYACIKVEDQETWEWFGVCSKIGQEGRECYDGAFCVPSAGCDASGICQACLEPCGETEICLVLDMLGPQCVELGMGRYDDTCYFSFCQEGLFCESDQCTSCKDDCTGGGTCVGLPLSGPTCLIENIGQDGGPCAQEENTQECGRGLRCDDSGICVPDDYMRCIPENELKTCDANNKCRDMEGLGFICVPDGMGDAGQACFEGICMRNPDPLFPYYAQCIYPDMDEELHPDGICALGDNGQYNMPCFDGALCDSGLTCEDEDCKNLHILDYYCDDEIPCNEGFNCIHVPEDRPRCIMGHIGLLGQICYQGDCIEGYCLGLEGTNNICASEGTGSADDSCFWGLCEDGLVCSNESCIPEHTLIGGAGCRRDEACEEGSVCGYSLTESSSCTASHTGFGSVCSSDSNCDAGLAELCRSFDPGGSMRCTSFPDVTDPLACDCGVNASCILSGMNTICGYPEWTRYYGKFCQSGDDCPDNYECQGLINEFFPDYRICTTPCLVNTQCPIGMECFKKTSDELGVCAVPEWMTFQKLCVTDEDCTENGYSNYPTCTITQSCSRACHDTDNPCDPSLPQTCLEGYCVSNIMP